MRNHRGRLERVEERQTPPPEFVPIALNDPATGEEVPGARESIQRAEAEGKTPIVVVRTIWGTRGSDCYADVSIRIPRAAPQTREGDESA